MNPDTLGVQMALYLDVLEAGSFSAAARRHPLTPSAVARRIVSCSMTFLFPSKGIRAQHNLEISSTKTAP